VAETVGAGTPAELLIEADGVRSVQPLEAAIYRFGRAPSNELSYPGMPGLSREHLVIERGGSQWMVRDLGSTHGTQVNGESISEPRILRPGDRITVARLKMLYREASKSVPQSVPQSVVFSDERHDPPGTTTISESLQGLIADESEGGGSHMQAIIAAGRELSTHLPLNQLFDLILDLTVKASGAARGVLMTLEKGELEVRSIKGERLRISSHVRDLVIGEKRSLLVRDAMSDAAFANRASIVMSQIRSMMAVPLQTDDGVIGLIYLDSSSLIKEFTKRDLSLVTVMASIAAVRIENARLAEVEQAERLRATELEHAERLRASELEHAATIQRSMLPSQFPPFPDRHDFELHASMVPAKEVGGDLFDFFLLDDERLAFLVGDVSGKGVPAALFMAITRTVLRATAHHHASAGACLTYMNQFLVDQNTTGMFITLFYGILNTRTGVLEFANAGHNPPYVISPGGSVRALKERSGPMLGVFDGIEYQTRSTEIAPGEGVFVFTDGVTEAIDLKGGFFDDARLEAYLAAHSSHSAEELVSGVQADVKRFEAGAPPADDVTVLALRRCLP
jgi:serine phosphatase RsbU (regulator of sigma subunit)